MFDLRPVHPYARQVFIPFFLDHDPARARLRPDQQQGLFHDLVQALALRMGGPGPGELEELLDQERHALELSLHDLQVRSERSLSLHLPDHGVDQHADRVERVAELMC